VLEMLKSLLRSRLQAQIRPTQPLAMDQTPKPTGR
jgi:P-type Ca2+ transporter type 2C